MIDVSSLIEKGSNAIQGISKSKTNRISSIRGWAGPIIFLLTALPFVGLLFAWLTLSVYFPEYEYMSDKAVIVVNTIGAKFFFSIISILLSGTAIGVGLLAKKNIETKAQKHEKEIEAVKEISKTQTITGFEAAYIKTLSHEGGYSNDPTDKGGETYKGISKKYHPNWRGWKYVDRYKDRVNGIKKMNYDKKLTALVQKFYYDEFWLKAKCDEISKLSDNVSIELFDTSVNCGISNAVKFFQCAVNLCTEGLGVDKLKDDGKIGRTTIETASVLLPKYNRSVIASQDYYQAKHYIDICEKDNSQYKYIRGWLTRT